jgi:hypothetical protein
MYTILTTCPDNGSRNVGDKLIEVRTKEMIKREKGDDEFFTIFREEPLEPHLETINRSKAVIMPLAVRDTPMYPGTYRLTEDLSAIKVPLIPIGACWNVYPGDSKSREMVQYSEKTVDFLHYLARGVEKFSCREHYTVDILKKHGVRNAYFTGDPAWFHLPSMGIPLRRPKEINRVVFSGPLSPYYLDQAKSIITIIAELFPRAERYCAMHLADAGAAGGGAAGAAERGAVKSENSAAMSPEVARKNREIRKRAEAQGFSILEMAGDIEKLNFYEGCDLHVGYECHAHLFFFSRRIPSVLIAEDARGVGFNYSLGCGGFTGFVRAQEERKVKAKSHTSGYSTSVEELVLAPPRNDIDREVKGFLLEETETNFCRYLGLDTLLDTLYRERMRPFISALP